MEQKAFNVSYFETVRSKKPITITLQQFINGIRGHRWEAGVNNYRTLKAAGKEKEAAKIKGDFPCIATCGIFEQGHQAANFRTPSGVICLDVDNYPDDLEELRRQLFEQPEVIATFRSISGVGLKLFIRICPEEMSNYTLLYRAIATHFSELMHFPCDEKCCDISRLCFASHDPKATYREEALPFRLPTPSQTILDFLNDFDSRNPFISGNRHHTMLKLGREAKMTGQDLAQLLTLSTSKYTFPDFTQSEVEKCISAGYQYINKTKVPQSLTKSLTYPFQKGYESEDHELFEQGEELRKKTPTLPDELFDRLPILLQQGLKAAQGKRERDMLLAGMLSILSGCLSSTRAYYARKKYSAHFYFFGVANAGAGKGVVDFAHLLAVPLHNYYLEQGKEAMQQFERLTEAWNREVKEARAEKRAADTNLQPIEPRIPFLLIPANASKTRYLTHLRDNGEMGGIINSGEADTLTYSLQQDCGKQDDLLRNATHHEMVSSSHKANGTPIVIPNPRLALCLTGTPEQLFKLIGNTENGLFSRFLFLTHRSPAIWQSAAPKDDDEEDYEKLFLTLGQQVLEMNFFLSASHTQIHFTPAQWRKHDANFSRQLAQATIEKENTIEAVIFRHGLLAIRIGMILTALRKWERKETIERAYCTDEDFQTALQITLTGLEHALLLSTSLETHAEKTLPLSPFYHIRPILDSLPNEFHTSSFIDKGKELQLAESTLKKYISKLEKKGIISKVAHGIYRIVDR